MKTEALGRTLWRIRFGGYGPVVRYGKWWWWYYRVWVQNREGCWKKTVQLFLKDMI